MDYKKLYEKITNSDWFKKAYHNKSLGECPITVEELEMIEDEKIKNEINILYSEIDACITELLKARGNKDSEAEGNALFKMEGLMVATLQDLSCIEDYLEERKRSLNFDAISSWLRDHANNYVNGEFNEFHHCVEYDGTIDVERLIADLKVAVDGSAFDVDAAFDTREPRDNWEYIKEFCDKFGRIPKDMDELDALVSYVMNKKQKEQKIAKEIEPKFKVGDTIRLKNSYAEYTIESISEGRYYCKGCSIDIGGGNRDYELVQQKPAEWSNEEKGILIECISELQGSGHWLLADRLSSLRPQPKHEWTIKDAKPGDILTTDTVTFIFKNVDKNGFVSMYCSYAVSTTGTRLNFSDTTTVDSEYVHPASIEQRREFLEELLRDLSSQLNWKPSAEQVKAIDLAIRFVTDDFDEHPTLSETLRGLYNDLKKL